MFPAASSAFPRPPCAVCCPILRCQLNCAVVRSDSTSRVPSPAQCMAEADVNCRYHTTTPAVVTAITVAGRILRVQFNSTTEYDDRASEIFGLQQNDSHVVVCSNVCGIFTESLTEERTSVLVNQGRRPGIAPCGLVCPSLCSASFR